MRPALFLDRDNTLIEDAGYQSDPSRIVPLPGAASALQLAHGLGYALFLFTNQSGVARGYFSLSRAIECCRATAVALGIGVDGFTAIGIAPEHPDATPVYRKPSPRFILESIHRYNLDPSRSWMVGDRPSDITAGIAAGIRTVAIASDPHQAIGATVTVPSVEQFVQDQILRT